MSGASLTTSVESANRSAEHQLRASNALGDPQRSGKATGASGAKRRRKPILIITVDIGGGKSGDINVFAGDQNEDLARAFCEKHNLNRSLIPAIAKHIENNVDALHKGELKIQPDEAQSQSEAKMPEQQKRKDQTDKAAHPTEADAVPSPEALEMARAQAVTTSGKLGIQGDALPPPAPAANAARAAPLAAQTAAHRERRDGTQDQRKSKKPSRYAENAKVYKLLGKPLPRRVRKPVVAAVSISSGSRASASKHTSMQSKKNTNGAPNSKLKKRVVRKKRKKKKKPKTNARDAAITQQKRGGDVYTRLYTDALSHWNRVDDEKRKDEERKHAEAVGFSYKPNIKTSIYTGVGKQLSGANAGERLHSSGHRFRQQKEEAARRAAAEREARNLAECTFRPAVNARSLDLVRRKRQAMVSSSSSLKGGTQRKSLWSATNEDDNEIFGRIYDPPAFSQKVIQLAQQQEEKEMAECTFRPRISERSRRIVERRRRVGGGSKSQDDVSSRQRDSSSGLAPQEFHQGDNSSSPDDNKFDELYMDEKRRREKQDEYVAWQEGQYSFKPDIGVNKARQVPDATQEGFYERMHKSGQARADKIAALRKKKEEVDPVTGQRLFQPKVGRAPNFVRNVHGLPVHEFLFASRHEYQDRKRLLEASEMRRAQENFNKSHVTTFSSKLVDQARHRRNADIFMALSGTDSVEEKSDNEGSFYLSADKELDTSEANFDALEESPLRDVVEPMVRRLNGATITFDEFCTLFDREIEDTNSGPLLSVLMSHGHQHKYELALTSARARHDKEESELTFKPKLNPKSNELASKLGRGEGASMPIHELLHKQSERYKANIETQRKRAAEKEMEECTFQPRLVSSSQNYGNIYQRLPGAYNSPTKSSAANNRKKVEVISSPYHDPDVWSPPNSFDMRNTSLTKQKSRRRNNTKRSPKSKTIQGKFSSKRVSLSLFFRLKINKNKNLSSF